MKSRRDMWSALHFSEFIFKMQFKKTNHMDTQRARNLSPKMFPEGK
jgi:hypothetical protein